MDWNNLAQDRDRWWAMVNMVRAFSFRKICGISWLSEQLLASQEGLCFLQLVGWLVKKVGR